VSNPKIRIPKNRARPLPGRRRPGVAVLSAIVAPRHSARASSGRPISAEIVGTTIVTNKMILAISTANAAIPPSMRSSFRTVQTDRHKTCSGI
jgi:hypothetical protein